MYGNYTLRSSFDFTSVPCKVLTKVPNQSKIQFATKMKKGINVCNPDLCRRRIKCLSTNKFKRSNYRRSKVFFFYALVITTGGIIPDTEIINYGSF